MANTYDRLKVVLRHSNRSSSWPSAQDLATDIRRRRLAPFRIRGDGSATEDYMQEPSIRKLVRLAIDLGLIEEDGDSSLVITQRGKTALENDDTFARQIRSSAKTYLDHCSLPFEQILDVINKVRLPDVPDAKTIYDHVARLSPRPEIDEASLTTLLYLLYCANGLARKVRAHYTSN